MPETPAGRFDLQGHRGARGLLPENTIPAFLAAVEIGVTTVELDVVVSRDRQLVVSHDPWFDPRICTRPDGAPVTPADRDRYAIFRLDYDQIAAFDCGRRRHPDFPRQRSVPAAKPRLADAVRAVEARVAELGREPVAFSIETKSRPEWDGTLQAPPAVFVRLLYDELEALGVLDRSIVQSFDVRTLRVLRALDPAVATSLLVERAADEAFAGDAARLRADLGRLGFTPEIYSPAFELVDSPMIREAHARGVRVIPWTVNDAANMERLIALGVDGLITDYPDLGREVVDRVR